MLQTGDSFLRRRLNATAKDEFPVLSDFLAAGMTDYVAIISRFAPQGVIGEMDGVYSSWATSDGCHGSDRRSSAARIWCCPCFRPRGRVVPSVPDVWPDKS